jgi:large subunit ribosomal protein L32
MAVPKRKTSKARKNKRRSSVWKMSAPTLVKCDHCGELRELTVSVRPVATITTVK